MILAAVVLAAILIWTGNSDRQTNPSPVTTALETPTAPDPSTLEWLNVTSWDYSSDDVSPPFHISARTWRVMWKAPHDSVGDGSFAVDVYNGDGTYFLDLYDTADAPGRSFDGPLTGTLGIDVRGDFFLRVSTTRNYEITVQELR